MSDVRPQPPPTTANTKERSTSRVKGWVRILPRGDRYSVYWQGYNDVMLLMAHSLTANAADAMSRDLERICRKYHDLPFTESTHVERSEIQADGPTQIQSEGSLEQSTE